MKPVEYEWALKEMMADPNYLYSSLIRDQYSLGKMISQKYRLLRIAYTIFMIELVLSSMIFAVFILFGTRIREAPVLSGPIYPTCSVPELSIL